MSARTARAPHWLAGVDVDSLADVVDDMPTIAPTPEAEPHIARARLVREATATADAETLARRVWLYVLAHLAVVHLDARRIAENVHADVDDVRAALAALTDAGLLTEPTEGRVDVLTPSLVALLAGEVLA